MQNSESTHGPEFESSAHTYKVDPAHGIFVTLSYCRIGVQCVKGVGVETGWPTSLAEMTSSRFSERPCLEQKEGGLKLTSGVGLLLSSFL